mgnify:FL=1
MNVFQPHTFDFVCVTHTLNPERSQQSVSMGESREAIHVLHVDDESDVVERTAAFLEREDDAISVQSVTSPADALATFDGSGIDCVLSGYEMPERNGIEFLERVRETYGDVPFILYTDKGSEEVASEAISAGVTDYLQKESTTSQYTVLANRIRNAVEQHRSRRAVAETERKLSELAERSDDILFMFDGDWSELLFVNSAYEEVWGGSIDRLEAEPESFIEHVHPDDREKARASMERIAKGEASRIEYRVVQADGEQRWVRGDTQPIVDEAGNVTRIVGQVRDVTEQKSRELHLETIIENLPGYVYRHEYAPEYPLEFVKGDAESITGYTATELEENVVQAESIIHPDDREELWENHIAAVEETGKFDSTYRIVTKDGEVRWIRDQGQLIENPATGERVIDGFITNVSERVKRKQELTTIKRRFEAVLENTTTPMFVKAADGSYIFVNQEYRDLFGFHDGEVVGRTDRELHSDEVATAIRRNDRAVLESGEPVEAEEHMVVDAEERAFLTTKVPVYDTGKRSDPDDPVGIFGVATDITERLVEQQRLSVLNRMLRHNIRNELNIIMGNVETVRELHSDGSTEEALQTIHERCQKLLQESRKVHEFQQLLDRDRREDHSLRAVIRTLREKAVQFPNAEFEVVSDGVGDATVPDIVEVALVELVENAFVHGGDDGSVRVRVEQPGPVRVAFWVTDEGPGLPEMEQRVLDGAVEEPLNHSQGFGLWMAYWLVQIAGGSMRLEPDERAGTAIRLQAPVAEDGS